MSASSCFTIFTLSVQTLKFLCCRFFRRKRTFCLHRLLIFSIFLRVESFHGVFISALFTRLYGTGHCSQFAGKHFRFWNHFEGTIFYENFQLQTQLELCFDDTSTRDGIAPSSSVMQLHFKKSNIGQTCTHTKVQFSSLPKHAVCFLLDGLSVQVMNIRKHRKCNLFPFSLPSHSEKSHKTQINRRKS